MGLIRMIARAAKRRKTSQRKAERAEYIDNLLIQATPEQLREFRVIAQSNRDYATVGKIDALIAEAEPEPAEQFSVGIVAEGWVCASGHLNDNDQRSCVTCGGTCHPILADAPSRVTSIDESSGVVTIDTIA